jgi:hypothetical protein
MSNVKMSEEYVEEDELLVDEVDETDDVEVDDYEAEVGLEVEDLDPSEELWENGPQAGQIVEWKKMYGDVFVSSFNPELHVVWRTMNRLEYRNHIKTMEQVAQSGMQGQAEAALLNEEAICEICVLFPRLSRDMMAGEMAGVPSSLSSDILEASGFIALEVRKL